jgi:site-specific DNA recombinase
MTVPVRAALYLRVSTGRQADNDLSIPDQRRQAKGYCASRSWEIVADYVEPGLSATDDRRPESQRMIDAATTKPPAFDVILVHSFSRFFRDQFQLEFYVRRLAKAGVRLVSIIQELGDDPMSNMIRQIMALFDEYQSKENAKHTLRAMKENARQGFWNGALPPIGYRIVEASEQRGHRTKKTLEIDPVQAETVRLIFRLAREGSGSSGPMGVKSIATHLNAIGIRTRDGGRWGVDAVHKVLTRTTYVGRHRFNTKFWKTRERKAETEVIEMAVPRIIDCAEFEAIQMLLKSRSPAMVAPRVVSGPTLLTGICFCAGCGGAMTLRTEDRIWDGQRTSISATVGRTLGASRGVHRQIRTRGGGLGDDFQSGILQRHSWVRNAPYVLKDPDNPLKSQRMRAPLRAHQRHKPLM